MAATTTTTSVTGTLNWRDILKGLLVAVITPVFTIIISSLNAGQFTLDWKAIGFTALAAALAYLSKNLFSPGTIIVTGESKETIKAVKEGDAKVTVK